MTYELVLAVLPPDIPNPVHWAYILMDPFCCTEECDERWQEEDHDEDDHAYDYDVPYTRCHFWDGAIVGGFNGRHFSGCLWRDRNGRRLPDHPINSPEDELRRVGDVDLRFLYLSPTALVTPDGDIYFMSGKPDGLTCTIAQFMAYEERLAAYPDHLAVPMACHS